VYIAGRRDRTGNFFAGDGDGIRIRLRNWIGDREGFRNDAWLGPCNGIGLGRCFWWAWDETVLADCRCSNLRFRNLANRVSCRREDVVMMLGLGHHGGLRLREDVMMMFSLEHNFSLLLNTLLCLGDREILRNGRGFTWWSRTFDRNNP
jgi:hypothetical protein